MFFRKRATADWDKAHLAMGKSQEVLEGTLDTFTVSRAGILVSPSADQNGVQAQEEIERALELTDSSEDHSWEVTLDNADNPHPWVITSAGNLKSLSDATYLAGAGLAAAGIGPRILAAVYPFLWKENRIYWIYQPRIKAFTPFAPNDSEEGRDHPLELRMEKAIRSQLPTSRDVKQWFPVWGMPL